MDRFRSVIAGALLVFTGVALSDKTPIAAAETTISPSSEQAQTTGSLTTIIAVLRPRGFDPARVAVPQGRVLLLVVNRAAPVGDPDIGIDDDRGQAILRAKASERRSEIWQTFTVSQGRKYKVRLSNHSTAVLEIEVQQ